MHLGNKPLVSLIICVYNTEKFVESCLDNIIGQTYKNIEIIVVNNGSKGNINSMIEMYKTFHRDTVIKMVVNKTNLGTFHGRGSGMNIARGKYFAFMDADDRIGIDYFYKMVEAAEDTGAEIVIADMVHEDKDRNAFRYIIDPVRFSNLEISGTEQIFDFYFGLKGLSYSMYGIWNKLFQRSLWDRSLPYIESIDEQFALCEDAVYTTIFFSQANKIKNIHDQYYYHFVHSESASSTIALNYQKAKNSIKYQAAAFRQMAKYLEKVKLMEKYKKYYRTFVDLHIKAQLFHIDNSSMSNAKKNRLRRLCKEEFKQNKIKEFNKEDLYFTKYFVTQTPYLENLRNLILDENIQYVCFSVYDTALIRNIWKTEDIFILMDEYYQELTESKINYCLIRNRAEEFAREKIKTIDQDYEEITYDEIFIAMIELFSISENIIRKLKNRELELEYNITKARSTVFSLYNLACRSGKKIIFVADTYLPRTFVENLLYSNGYKIYDRLYLSNEERLKIKTGNIFDKLKSESLIECTKNLLYVESDFRIDIETVKCGNEVKSFYFPRVNDVMCNHTSGITYSGEIFNSFYKNIINFMNDIETRCMLSQIASRLFDNPFVQFHDDANFNGDPYYMGYFTSGMFVYSVSAWIAKQTLRKNIKKLLFIGSETKLIKSVFDIISRINNISIETGIIELDRCGLPFLYSKKDALDLIPIINITEYSLKDIVKSMVNILSESFIRNAQEICNKNNISYQKKFNSIHSFVHAIDFIGDTYIDPVKIQKTKKFLNEEDAIFLTSINANANHFAAKINSGGKIISLSELVSPIRLPSTFYTEVQFNDNQSLLMDILFSSCDEQATVAKYSLFAFHEGTIDFAREFAASFGPFFFTESNYHEACQFLFFYLLNKSKDLDRFLLEPIEICTFGTTRIMGSDIWKINTDMYFSTRDKKLDNVNNSTIYSSSIRYDRQRGIKKYIYLLFFDRELLKKKIISRYGNNKYIMPIIKISTKIMRLRKVNFVHRKI
jgi:glycosyltransferase involved in cell wall biosynthesis